MHNNHNKFQRVTRRFHPPRTMSGETPAKPDQDTAYVRDMLLSLRELASRNNQKLLVYFLEMAAFEAARLADSGRTDPGSSPPAQGQAETKVTR